MFPRNSSVVTSRLLVALAMTAAAAACADGQRSLTSPTAPAILTPTGLASGASKVALCHTGSDGTLVRIVVSGNAVSAHLSNHSQDGLVGTGYADPDNEVLYDDTCQALPERPTAIFVEDFNDMISSGAIPNDHGSQYQTGAPVYAWAPLPGWSVAGGHAGHSVEWQPGNIAATLIDTNVYTMLSGISANDAGATYTVSYLSSPAVWQVPSQASQVGDGIVIEVLRANGTVLHQYTQLVAPWAGANVYVPGQFTYFGDGSGDVRIRLSDNLPGTRFGGGIDDLTVSR